MVQPFPRKLDAEAAIAQEKVDLIDTLSCRGALFQAIISTCEGKRMITGRQSQELLDANTREPLRDRVGYFIQLIQTTVKITPNILDDFLCILHENGDCAIQVVAEHIAKACKLMLM